MIVPDLLQPGLDLVLCGTAPSLASKAARAYYAHPGNIFWKTLHDVGLTPRRLAPSEFPELLSLRIGLTDLNKTEWGADAELTHQAFDIKAFSRKMHDFRPKVIAFDSKHAACKFYGKNRVEYGQQPESAFGATIFVLPSTSGRARMYFDLKYWQELASYLISR